MKKSRQLVITAVIVALFSVLPIKTAFAASTTMDVSPQTGSYGAPFTVNLVIDGHGDKFNAAQATVALSSGLAVKDLVLGDCNFSFLKTPSMQNPSFAGVILSSYATKCSVYTLTLVPIAKGSATLSLSKTAAKRYGDAANILSSASNGSYTLTTALKPPSVLGTQTANNPQSSLYTVFLKIQSPQSNPVSGATVILNPVSSKQKKQQGTTDATGTVHFSNLQAGIYDAIVEVNNTKVGETIINVSGQNHVLTFGIKLEGQKNNPIHKNSGLVLGVATSSPIIIAGIAIVGVIAGTVLTIVLTRLKGSRKLPA